MPNGTLGCWIPTSPATIQDAIDSCALAGGGTVYLPTGTWNRGNAQPLLISTPNVHLLGDGPEATILQNHLNDVLHIQASHTSVSRMTLYNGDNTDAHAGLVIGGGNAVVVDVKIEDCVIRDFGGDCLRLADSLSANPPEHCMFINCQLYHSYGAGHAVVAIGSGNRSHRFERCTIASPRLGAGVLKLDSCDTLSFIDCTFETDNISLTGVPFVDAHQTSNVLMQHCWFEEHMPYSQPFDFFIALGDSCHAWHIDTCTFARAEDSNNPSKDANPRTIKVGTTAGSGCASVVIVNPIVHLTYAAPLTGSHAIQWLNGNDECYLIGGCMSGPDSLPMPISLLDSSLKSQVLQGIRRLKLATADPASLAIHAPGDCVFGNQAGVYGHRVAVYSGSGYCYWQIA